jgi:hypothetical protein
MSEENDLDDEVETAPAEVTIYHLLDTKDKLPLGPIIDLSEIQMSSEKFSQLNMWRMTLISTLNQYNQSFGLHCDEQPIEFRVKRSFNHPVANFADIIEKELPQIYRHLSSQFVALRQKSSDLAIAMDPRTIEPKVKSRAYLFQIKDLVGQITGSLRTVSVNKSGIEGAEA